MVKATGLADGLDLTAHFRFLGYSPQHAAVLYTSPPNGPKRLDSQVWHRDSQLWIARDAVSTSCVPLSLAAGAVGCRGYADFFAENHGEILNGIKSCSIGHGLDRQIGTAQQFFCPIQTYALQILG